MNKLSINNIEKSVIEDAFIVSLNTFSDLRGENFECFNQFEYDKIFETSQRWKNEAPKFLIDSFSKSRYSVLRGFHGDENTWKLIQCLEGEIQFCIIDLRKDSSSFEKHEIFHLNDKEKKQILVPRGCVNAHLCLSEKCLFHYKLTHAYVEQEKQFHVKWDNPKFKIDWKIKNPVLSPRDT